MAVSRVWLLWLLMCTSSVQAFSSNTEQPKPYKKPLKKKCNKRTFREQDFPPEVYNIDPLPSDSSQNAGYAGYARATRLVQGRSYARQNAFALDQMQELPNLQDLSSPPHKMRPSVFLNRFRVLVLVGSFLAFAPLTSMIATYMPAVNKLEALSENNFVPGISIVYGTYLSLTLSILYTRQQKITEFCAKETSQLLQLTRRIMHLFRNDDRRRLSAAEYIADQVRILVKASRGRELMKVIYSDPYEGMDSLLNEYRDDMEKDDNSASLVDVCSDSMTTIVLTRSERLSSESTFLPPVHFVVAKVLAAMLIVGYTIATVPIVDENGQPPLASSAFFAVLCLVYIFFSTITGDLNNPFTGVYQIRRSGIAANLLAIKWILQKDPLLGCDVNFEGEVGHPLLWEDPILIAQMKGGSSSNGQEEEQSEQVKPSY